MKTVTVEQSVTRMHVEKRTLEFPSLVDPPVKCCRCFPNSISEKGFCGCCCFDHSTGERIEVYDPEVEW